MNTSLYDDIRRVANGDREATARLYDRFAPRLLRRLRARYVPLGLDAQELLHDAFVFYLQHDARVLHTLLDRHTEAAMNESDVDTYLWDLACGVASNKRRSLRRATIVPLHRDALRSPDGTAGATLDRDLLERLDRCLSGKSDRVYLYFKLRYVDGLDPVEIASCTGWSRKATYKLRQAFNEALSDCAARLEIAQ